MNFSRMTERWEFIKKSLQGTTWITIGGMAFSSKSYSSVIGSHDRLVLAVAGIRGRGGDHIESWRSLAESRNIRLKTICEVDEQFFTEGLNYIFDKTGT
jgi:hypothetical protein